MQWLTENKIAFSIIFTKSDKLKPNDIQDKISSYKEILKEIWEEMPNYFITSSTKYIGKVKYDTDTYNQSLEDAIENGDIEIDTWADENEPHQLTKIKLVEPMTKEEEDKNAGIVRDKDGNAVAVESMYGTKEESDVDVALNLQAESQRGK